MKDRPPNKHDKRRSKRLSWLLRHGAPEAGVHMDPAGFVEIRDLLNFFSMSRAKLDELVLTNNKGRLQIVGTRIRCCQGHSRRSGVSAKALEASWQIFNGDDTIWHGTSPQCCPRSPAKVCSRNAAHTCIWPPRSAASSANEPRSTLRSASIHSLRSVGHQLWRAQNGVILARQIPPEKIIDLQPMTRRTRARECDLRTLLLLPKTNWAAP